MRFRNFSFSKSKKREFAALMAEIDDFCAKNGISQSSSGDSYYFTIEGTRYRVSNHTVEASNRGAYDPLFGKTRELYHPNGEDGLVCITASKTRICEIYEALKAGKKLNRRGYAL